MTSCVSDKQVSRASDQHCFPMDLPEAVAEDAVASSEFGALPRCGSSATVAVSPDGGQQLDGCRGTRAALRRAAAAYGGAVAFRSFTGPLVLSSGFWVYDGFQLFWSVRRPDADDRQLLTPQQRAFGALHLET